MGTGIILLTYAALFHLHNIRVFLLQMLEQFRQLKQKVRMQSRAASRHFDKRVGLQKIGPDRRNLPQMTGRVTKKQIAFAENALVLDQVKLLATKRMKCVRNPHSTMLLR